MRVSRRLIAPAILLALIAAAWASGLAHHLSWAGLADSQATMKSWVAAHPWLAPCLFLLVYIASVTLSLPHAALLSMLGGLLFGTPAGGALAASGASIGGVFLFLIARSSFAEPLARRCGAELIKLREELRRNGFAYLLALRLIPLVPFWLINLAAALCGMRLRTFAAATAVGILPVTFIITSIGASIGGVLDRGEPPSLAVLFSWRVLAPLIALAAVSVMPVLWRKWQERHA